MYCRSFSKPVSGDGAGVGDPAGAGLELEVSVGVPPPQAPKNKTPTSTNTQRISFIARLSKRILQQLLIPDVHDRTLRILVNNIKPAARTRLIEEVVMHIV